MKVTLAALLSVLTLIVFTGVSLMPLGLAQNTSVSYMFLNQADGAFSHKINVVVPQSLNDFYRGLSHKSASESDFPKFVTPYAVEPIANCLRQIHPDDEDFANGVLTLVHQIPYEETLQEYYPVETLTRNKGDCDMISFLAASIMKAGGLDVVLLHYTTQTHMNVGVHLESEPKDVRFETYSFDNSGLVYYVAESTSSNWKEGWRVGECPDDLKNSQMVIIELEQTEHLLPGQVSASFNKLEPTTLKVNISPYFITEGNYVTLNGKISPVLSNQNVTIYWSVNGGRWTLLVSTLTGADGTFFHNWKGDVTGLVSLKATWAGNENFAGAVSETQQTIILPLYLIAAAAIAVALVIVCLISFRITNKKQKGYENL